MKRLIALLLCLLIPSVSFASEPGFKVAYDGGSLPNIKAGANGRLVLDSGKIVLMVGKEAVATIDPKTVTEISYGQDVHRRIGAAIGVAVFTLGIGALLALTKSKKHFIGITWADGDKKGGFAMQADKSDYRGLLAAMEGLTGKKAVDTDAMNVKN